jgi:competence protein ComEA
MLKKLLLILAMLWATTAFAAVDVNKASAAELDGIKGIGPAISERILTARKAGNFKDWNDFIERVQGVGEKTAAKFSESGLTVNGKPFNGAVAATAATSTKADSKVADKAGDKPASKAKEAAAPAKVATPAATAASANKPAATGAMKN